MPDHTIYRQYLRNHLNKLTTALNGMGLHREAAARVPELFAADPDHGRGHYQVAVVFAGCAAACQKDAKLSDVDRARLRESYAAQAVARLRQAHAAGFDITSRLADRRFDTLRERGDYRALEADAKCW